MRLVKCGTNKPASSSSTRTAADQVSGYGGDNRKKARVANANFKKLHYACRFVLRPEMQNEAKF